MKHYAAICISLFLVCVHTGLSAHVVYIYSSTSPDDSLIAIAYKSLLGSRGYPTSLVRMTDILSTNFSLYDVILIGDGTGYVSSWGDPARVAAVNNSNKPIIGFGEGGYAFFGRLSLQIGWGNGAHGSAQSIRVVSPTHPVFNSPNIITIPPDSLIQLYAASSPMVEIFMPTPASNITWLGQDAAFPPYHLLIKENARYLLWGFSSSPQTMTQTGIDLVHNVVAYMSTVTSVQQPAGHNELSQGFSLLQNYPNPFNPSTTISFMVTHVGFVSLSVYSALGQEVATLVNKQVQHGIHQVAWDASKLPSGVYYCRLRVGAFAETRKLVLLR